jgi:hypothetical protein
MDPSDCPSRCIEISNELPQRRELVSRPAAGHCWTVRLFTMVLKISNEV